MSNNSGGGFVIVLALIVCAVLVMTLGGGAHLIEGFLVGKQAERTAAQAVLVQAQARYVISEAVANSIRTDAAQTWLVPIALGCVIVLLIGIVMFEVYRVIAAERRMMRVLEHWSREEMDANIHDVNRALQARRNAELNAPRVLEFDARGKLAQWEAGRRR